MGERINWTDYKDLIEPPKPNSTFSEYNLTELNIISLAILKSQKVSYILWILLGSINFVGAALTVFVLYYWKPLQTTTNCLIVSLAVSDVFFSISIVYVGAFHEYNIYFDISEVTTKSGCFLKICILLYFHTLNALLYLAISQDRLVASIFPICYKNRHPASNKLLVGFLWISCLVLLIFAYVYRRDEGENESVLLVTCLAREPVSEKFYKFYLYLILLSNLISVLLYFLLIIILKAKLLLLKKNDNASIAEIRSRMTNKVTHSLAINCVIHFFTVTLAALASLSIGNLPYRGAALSPYVNLSAGIDGITNFIVYYICQQQFREGVWGTLKRFRIVKVSALNNDTWISKSTNSTRGSVGNKNENSMNTAV